MMTARKQLANEANAAKSTGPKTLGGRSRSARNSKKHGLTSAPEWKDVSKLYRIILKDPLASPKPFETDAYLRATLELARAEAILARTVRETHELFFEEILSKDSPRETDGHLYDCIDMIMDVDEWEGGIDSKGQAILTRLFRAIARAQRRRSQDTARKWRLLDRYRSEAASQRRRALKHWIGFQNPETKPITT